MAAAWGVMRLLTVDAALLREITSRGPLHRRPRFLFWRGCTSPAVGKRSPPTAFMSRTVKRIERAGYWMESQGRMSMATTVTEPKIEAAERLFISQPGLSRHYR